MKTKGFTLVELVIVIVILGILSITALPRFLHMSDEARSAVLQGTATSLVTAAEIAHSKLELDNLANEVYVSSRNKSVKEWCKSCTFSYGYPTTRHETWKHITKGIGQEERHIDIGNDKEGKVIFTFGENLKKGILQTENCYIKYTPATKNKEYKIEVVECLE